VVVSLTRMLGSPSSAAIQFHHAPAGFGLETFSNILSQCLLPGFSLDRGAMQGGLRTQETESPKMHEASLVSVITGQG
jgi:hypothetical protein